MPKYVPNSVEITSFVGKYRFLSNFAQEPDGKTVEHRFQASKTLDIAERRLIMAAPGPRDAKRMGSAVQLRSDWDSVKDAHMLYHVERKFVRWQGLRELLLATGNATLIEGNSWGDRYWGAVLEDDVWVGRNQLGKTLMYVRAGLLDYFGRRI